MATSGSFPWGASRKDPNPKAFGFVPHRESGFFSSTRPAHGGPSFAVQVTGSAALQKAKVSAAEMKSTLCILFPLVPLRS